MILVCQDSWQRACGRPGSRLRVRVLGPFCRSGWQAVDQDGEPGLRVCRSDGGQGAVLNAGRAPGLWPLTLFGERHQGWRHPALASRSRSGGRCRFVHDDTMSVRRADCYSGGCGGDRVAHRVVSW